MKSPNTIRLRILTIAATLSGVLSLFNLNSFGQTSTWNGSDNNGLWNDGVNWTGGVPNGSGAIADFSQLDLTGAQGIHINSPETVGGVIFGTTDTGTAVQWTADNSSTPGNTLTLSTSSGIPFINVTDPLALGNTATVTAVIAGNQGLAIGGGGELILGGTTANTFTGGITVSNGTLFIQANGNDASSSDTLTLGSALPGPTATLVLTGTAFPNPIVLKNNAAITADPVLKPKPDLTSTTPINLNGFNLTFTAVSPSGNSIIATGTGSGVSGTGNLTLVQNGGGTILNNGTFFNIGSITLQGSGTGKFGLGTISSNMTVLNYNSSSATVNAQTITANNNGTTINSSSTLGLSIGIGDTAGSAEAGTNVFFNCNSTGNITVTSLDFRFHGLLENTGTGKGATIMSGGIFNNSGMTAMVENSATSPLILSAADYYNVPTLVSNGWLLQNNTLSAGQKASPITVYSGGTLGGTGIQPNLVTVLSGGTLAPGTNDGFTLGTLSITNSGALIGALSLNGNLFFKLHRGLTQSNDFVTGTAILTNLGTGTLTLSNVAPGTPIVQGDRFVLFSKPLIGGNNLTIVSYPGGQWMNNLAVDGSVTAGAQAPLITSVSPPSGTTFGGTLVTINGANFASGATVQFGAATPITANFVSSIQLTVTSPAGSAGPVNLIVANPSGFTATNTYTYVAIPPPSVTSLSPTNGPTSGGTSVTITGSNFVSGDTVQFGSVQGMSVNVANSTTITVTTPIHAAGLVGVTVTDSHGQFSTLANSFLYITPVTGIWVGPNNSGDGLWTGDTANWSNNIVPNAIDQTADFGLGDYTGGQAVHVDAPVIIGNAIFGTTNTSTSASWSVDNNGTSGNVLTLETAAGTPNIAVNDPLALGNSAAISAVIAGNQGLMLTGGGMLTLGANGGMITNQFGGGITVANGTLLLELNANDTNANDVLTLGSSAAGANATLMLETNFPNPIVLATNSTGSNTISGDPLNSPGITLQNASPVQLNGSTFTFLGVPGSLTSALQSGVTGNGNVILVQNGIGTMFNRGTINNNGSLTLEGTGSGNFNLGTLANITALNFDTSDAGITGASILSVNPTNITAINSDSTLVLPIGIGQGVGPALMLNCNSSGPIQINSVDFRFGGNLINSGTGTGMTFINVGIFNNSGMSNMIQDSATSPLVISGNDFYNVPTVVSNGWLVDNSTGSANEKGSPITVCNGGTLSGIGVIGNLVTVNPGGTFAPGTNDAYTIGTLTFSNNNLCIGALSLSGNLFFKLNPGAAQPNDYVTTIGTAAYTNLGTGVLTVANVGSNPLTPGEVFQLFSTNVVGGNNLTISGPVAFVNDLAVNGTIVVGGGSSSISISSIANVAGNLMMVWQGGAGQNGVLLASTNLLMPISQWTPLVTNTIGSNGLSTNTIPIDPSLPAQFFLLSTP